jgi:hypothetical protein
LEFDGEAGHDRLKVSEIFGELGAGRLILRTGGDGSVVGASFCV